MPKAAKSYGVRLVRGPFVSVEPHPDAVNDAALLAERDRESQLWAADLFCGCGGISLGFHEAGITSVVGVDHDASALETWAANFPGYARLADLQDPVQIDELVDLLAAVKPDVISGGPPCQPFSRAGRSKIRDLVRSGVRQSHDDRRDLWRSFIDIAIRVKPRAVVMENVPDLALADDMLLLRTIVDELESSGYGVHTRIVSAQDHGVPQLRQRLILVALELGTSFEWPSPKERLVTLADAVKDLPPVKPGWRPDGGAEGWTPYEAKDPGTYAVDMRRRVRHPGRLYDHITRPVRDDDLEIFRKMDSTTKYSDIDPKLQRYRDDIFTDKYKRLDWDQPSRSITAHIAKDGYWYIHPEEHRTITIREAARIQSFPDHVRFAGPPSAAFRQIGNAVPPRLAEAIAGQLTEALAKEPGGAVTTKSTSSALAEWLHARAQNGFMSVPWRAGAPNPWVVLAAEILAGSDRSVARSVWSVAQKNFTTPSSTLKNEDRVFQVGSLVGKPARAEKLIAVADALSDASKEELSEWENFAAVPGISNNLAKLAETLGTPGAGHVLALQPALRVAARFSGRPVDLVNKNSDGRLEIARLVGGSIFQSDAELNRSRDAFAALLELGETLCGPKKTECAACPLAFGCVSRSSSEQLSL